jgi:ornithine cyclodeaminase
LTVEAILANDNVVDDIDHVCRAQTSIHLAEEASGTRSFIRGTLGDVLLGNIPPKQDEEDVTVFSPFGLGILDLAVGKLVYDFGREQDKGTLIGSFLSNLWAEEAPPRA